MENPIKVHDEKLKVLGINADFSTDTSSYSIYCLNASAAVYAFNCICINVKSYETLIDNSDSGYALWLYAGTSRLDYTTLRIVNTALEQRYINLRVRLEPLVLVEGLGRRGLVGMRYALRIEPSGLIDLAMTEDTSNRTDGFYASAARTLPRIAVWHMSYCDVDEGYDLGYRQLLSRSDRYTCSIVRRGKTTLNISG